MIFLAGLKYVESFTRFGMIGSKLTGFFKGVETKKQEELTNQISSSDSSAAGLMDLSAFESCNKTFRGLPLQRKLGGLAPSQLDQD